MHSEHREHGGFNGLTLFIGLGGTGYEILMKIREKLYRETGKTVFGEIEYLYIDGDSSNIKGSSMIKNNDGTSEVDINLEAEAFLHITENEPSNMSNYIKYFERVQEFVKSGPKDYNNYVGDHFPTTACGQIRMVGKLYLTKKYKKATQMLTGKLSSLMSITVSQSQTSRHKAPPINIMVFGSLAGGTGSGTAVDLPFIIEKALPAGTESHIWGFFADHSFFRGLPFTDNLEANVFGALSELDYWASNKGKAILPYAYQENPGRYYQEIFLMQNTTEKGIVSKSEMEDMAAQAATSLANNSNADNLYNSSLHKEMTTGNKKRILSSFGISSIEFNRVQVLDYYITKQLYKQLNYLRAVIDNNIIQEKVDKFINENRLNEGIGESANKMNQLIEKLCPLDKKVDKVISDVKFRNVTTGKNAHTSIVTIEKDYLDNLETEITNLINDNNDINDLKEDITKTVNLSMQKEGGIVVTKKFLRNLSSQLTAMMEGLSLELEEHIVEESKIKKELKDDRTELLNIKVFFGWINKEKQEIAYIKYIEKLSDLFHDNSSLAKERIEIKRKEVAIKYYKELVNHIYSFYKIEDGFVSGKIYKLADVLDKLYDKISNKVQQREKNAERGQISFGNIVNIDNLVINKIKDIVEKEKLVQSNILDIMSFEKQIQTNNNINDLLKIISDNLLKQYKISVEGVESETMIVALLKPELYPLERFLIRFLDKKSLDPIFNTVNINNQVLWQHDVTGQPTDSGKAMRTAKTLGIFTQDVSDLQSKLSLDEFIFKSPKNKKYLTFDSNSPKEPINNKNPNKIAFLLLEDSIPMFTLYNAVEMQKEHKALDKMASQYFYTDDRIYNLNHTIFPSKGDVKEWWTIANVLDIVTFPSGGYKIKTKKAKSGDGMQLLVTGPKGRSDRDLAYNAFTNGEYVDEIKKNYQSQLEESKEKVKEKFIAYVKTIYKRSNIGKHRDNLSEKEQNLINDELKIAVRKAVLDFEVPERDLICVENNITEQRITDFLD